MFPWDKKKIGEDDDVVILIQDQEIRELPVSAQNEEAIYAGELKLPKLDAQIRYYPSGGRAYIYGYSAPQLAETENIARLEKSSIIRSLFNYPSGKLAGNTQLYVFLAVLVIVILILHH